MGAVAKSYRRKVFLIYDKMRKYLVIYEDAVCYLLDFLIYEGFVLLFYQCNYVCLTFPLVPP
jgi:hypothetical protein